MKPAGWKVILQTSSAQRAVKQIPEPMRSRIIARLRDLAVNPWCFGSSKLSGVEAWKIRVGDYRIVYTIDQSTRSVLVEDIDHRRDVYRNL